MDLPTFLTFWTEIVLLDPFALLAFTLSTILIEDGVNDWTFIFCDNNNVAWKMRDMNFMINYQLMDGTRNNDARLL